MKVLYLILFNNELEYRLNSLLLKKFPPSNAFPIYFIEQLFWFIPSKYSQKQLKQIWFVLLTLFFLHILKNNFSWKYLEASHVLRSKKESLPFIMYFSNMLEDLTRLNRYKIVVLNLSYLVPLEIRTLNVLIPNHLDRTAQCYEAEHHYEKSFNFDSLLQIFSH